MFAADLDLGLAENAKQELFGLINHPVKTLSQKQFKMVQGLVKHVEAELGNDRTISINYLSILLIKCLGMVNDKRKNASRSANSNIVDRFQKLVEIQFIEQKKVSAFATELNISSGHLNELCKARIGKSASEVIKDRVLLEAKRLLLHSELSIKEIAYALNMLDPAYFTRMFKKGTGKGPQQFREQIREKYK